MRIDDPTKEQLRSWFNNLDNYVKSNFKLVETKYVDLGMKTLRILNYSKEFTHLMEKQLTYSLKDSAEKYDATLILWKEPNIKLISRKIAPEKYPKLDVQARVRLLSTGAGGEDLWMLDNSYSTISCIMAVDLNREIAEASDFETNTYYLGVTNPEPEEFIKEGHIFVQIFNRILRTPSTNLVHGATVGINNKGILFCARGQRGKSTLAVLSMMSGFEYVSDDYLTLEKTSEGLFSYPIYSIITLSPRMYNELFDRLNGSRFLFNNARKDKYVINIANFHKQFRSKYPVKVCMFPEIVSDKEPSIVKCGKEEKGRAIVQLIQSSVSQMQDINNPVVIKKIFDMVKDFEFYKINLCQNINKNTEKLREFIENYKPQKDTVVLDRFLTDITFDVANILDTKDFIIYTMNKFATNIYDNILHGVTPDKILKELSRLKETPLSLSFQIETFIETLKQVGLIDELKDLKILPKVSTKIAKECDFRLSLAQNKKDGITELIRY